MDGIEGLGFAFDQTVATTSSTTSSKHSALPAFSAFPSIFRLGSGYFLDCTDEQDCPRTFTATLTAAFTVSKQMDSFYPASILDYPTLAILASKRAQGQQRIELQIDSFYPIGSLYHPHPLQSIFLHCRSCQAPQTISFIYAVDALFVFDLPPPLLDRCCC